MQGSSAPWTPSRTPCAPLACSLACGLACALSVRLSVRLSVSLACACRGGARGGGGGGGEKGRQRREGGKRLNHRGVEAEETRTLILPRKFLQSNPKFSQKWSVTKGNQDDLNSAEGQAPSSSLGASALTRRRRCWRPPVCMLPGVLLSSMAPQRRNEHHVSILRLQPRGGVRPCFRNIFLLN